MTNKAQRRPGMANKGLKAELRFLSPYGPKTKSGKQLKSGAAFGSKRK